MANITVSTSSNFDATANLALNHNETVTVTSGATLTINADTRYAQNAAAPVTITISEGSVVVDGRDVWWIPFDASTGNVPTLSAQGTLDVTVGGVDVGELLGVWDTYAVPKPLVAGVSMPATGFIKLRRKVATIADNDVLTFSNGATATVNSATGGQRGWIDLVGTSFYTANFLSGGIYCNARSTFRVFGDWFELGETTGVAGQIIQHYVPTYCPAIQIETSPGSGVYEWYVSYKFGLFPPATIGTTLANSTFGRAYTSTSTGEMTLGYNSQFYLPPAGCKIRVPNISVNTVAAGSYDTYTFSALPWRLWGHDYADVQIDTITLGTATFHSKNAAKYYVTNSAFKGGDTSWYMQLVPSSAKDWKFDNVAVAVWGTQSYTNTCLFIYGDKVTIKNALFTNSHSSLPLVYSSTNVLMENITYISTSSWGSNATSPIFLKDVKDVSIKNFRGYSPGSGMMFLNNVENFDADDVGIITTDFINGIWTAPGTGITGNVKKARFNDFKAILGKMGGHGFDSMFNLSGEELVFSNWGSPSAPYEVNSTTAYRNRRVPQYNWNVATAIKQDQFNIWLSSVTGGALYNNVATSSDVTYNYCGMINTTTPSIEPISTLLPNSRLRNSVTTMSGGTEYIPYQHYVNDLNQSTSQIRFAFFAFPVSDVRVTSAISSFGEERDGTNLYLTTIDDYVEITTDEILGVTALTTATITSTGSINVTYDIDTGTGFSGTYKTLNNTNLAAETVSASGFKLRVQAKATATGNNYISNVLINATTSTANIQANYYSISEPNLNINNVVTGSTLASIRTTDGKLLFITEAAANSQTIRPGWSANVDTIIRARKAGYSSLSLPYLLTYRNADIPINQLETSIPATNPGALSITVTNHGASPVTWNGKQWSITITATGGETAAQIANFINYNLANESRSFDSAYYNMQWPEMVIAVGTGYETVRGTLYGSAGAALKGVRVVDGSGNEIPGFVRMQADDGTYYVSPTVATITVSNLVSGDRVLVARDNGSGAVLKDEYTPVAASTGATSIQVVESIKTDTPTSGVIRIKNERYTYSGYNTGTKTFSGLSPALTQNIVAGDDVFVPFIDKATTTTSESVTFLYSSTFGVTVDVRNGSATPIIPFRTTASVTSTGASINTIRTADI